MKKLILAFLLLVTPNCYAQDYWVYVRTYDRSGITADDDKGRSKRGDVVAILPCTDQYIPTEQEKKSYLILKTSDLNDTEKTQLISPMYDEESKEVVKPIIAYRKNKFEFSVLNLFNNVGVQEDKINKTLIINNLYLKTAVDFAQYERSRFIYLVLQRPFEKLARVILPYAYASTVVSTINKSGEDYNTLTLWEDDKDGDLVTATTIQEADVYDDDGALTDNLVIDGSTTSADYYMLITAPVGERHNGTVASGAKVTFTMSGAGQKLIDISDNYVNISWLILNLNFSSTVGDSCATVYNTLADEVIINNCILYATGTPNIGTNYGYGIMSAADSSTQTDLYILNCIVYGFAHTTNDFRGIYLSTSATRNQRATIQNCTVYNCDIGVYTYVNIGASGLTTVNNTLAIDCDTCFTWNGNYAEDYNASSDATAAGAHDINSGSGDPPAVGDFVSVTDLHLAAGAPEINTGTDLGTTKGVNIDIDNRNRDSEGDTWDIGADEYVAAAGLSDSQIF